MMLRTCVLLVLGVALVACSTSKVTANSEDITAEAIGSHECEACGMLIRDQPAPRAQLIHKDGQRQFFCSVSDMLTYTQAPSPHGAVVASFVEILDPSDDPMNFSVVPRPWSRAEDATYVLGVDKPKVMGTPVLIYKSPADAQAVATKHNGTPHQWNELIVALGFGKE